MNPLDKIKRGISEQDWGLVCEGYNAITGHGLSSPTESDSDSVTSKSTIQLFKRHILRMVEDFELPTLTDQSDAKKIVVDVDDNDADQSEDDEEENVDFNAVTEPVERKGLFGNTTVLITEKPKQSQIEENQKRYANREGPKVSRPPPKTYQVKCTDCDKPFKSRVQSGEFGQKCPSCLRATRRDR